MTPLFREGEFPGLRMEHSISSTACTSASSSFGRSRASMATALFWPLFSCSLRTQISSCEPLVRASSKICHVTQKSLTMAEKISCLCTKTKKIIDFKISQLFRKRTAYKRTWSKIAKIIGPKQPISALAKVFFALIDIPCMFWISESEIRLLTRDSHMKLKPD